MREQPFEKSCNSGDRPFGLRKPTLLFLVVALVCMSSRARAADEQASPSERRGALQSITLADVVHGEGKTKIVDLTYPLNHATPYWPGKNYSPFQLRTIATLEKDGVLSKMFSTPEHLGTHIDAPNHFAAHQRSVDLISPDDLIGPGVVIDVRKAVAGDPDYRLSLRDLERWEGAHGLIPDGAIVLMLSGWGQHYHRRERYQNRDAQGQMHFPGYSVEAARWLIENRHVRGLGIDTMSIDPGISEDFGVHHVVNGAGRYGLENLARLDRLPPRDFVLIVAPIKIETGSGGPTRVLALVPNESRAFEGR